MTEVDDTIISELDPVDLVWAASRCAEWQMVATLVAGGLCIDDAIDDAIDIREAVDNRIRAEYRKKNGIGADENLKPSGE